MKLKSIRRRINKIDDKIFSLLLKRLDLAELAKKLKEEKKLPIYQPKREKEILDRMGKKARRYRINEKKVKEIYKKIITICRDLQLNT